MIEQHDSENKIRRLVQGWYRRAGVVRFPEPSSMWSETKFDETIPDYPLAILPFGSHPIFNDLSHDKVSRLLTWAWIAYNERVITAERRVVNPALSPIADGIFPGVEVPELARGMHQTLIDENYHTLMHVIAIQETRAARAVVDTLQLPHSVTFRRLQYAQATCTEAWQKLLLTLLWAVVAEVSINALLTLLSTDKTIQPMHRKIASLHNRDEYAHSSLVMEAAKAIYPKLDGRQKAFFVRYLPDALNAFSSEDYSVWETVLPYVGCTRWKEMLEDVKIAPAGRNLVRDYSGVRRLTDELGVTDDVNFEFTSANCFPADIGDIEISDYV